MQQALGTLFKKRQFWLRAGVFVAVLAGGMALWSALTPQPALAAGEVKWLNHGALVYKDKTYVLQKRDFGNVIKGASYPHSSPFDDHAGVNEQDSGIISSETAWVIYAVPGTPTCIDKNNREHFLESITFVIDIDVNSYSRGTYSRINQADKGTNGLNCTFLPHVTVTSNNPTARRIWFFKDKDKVYTFDKTASFTKSGTGPGGAELYYRDGDSVAQVNGVACKDLLVDTGGGKWLIYPMGPQNEVASYFSPGRTARSESYDIYTQSGGRTTANCLVNSLELRTELLVGVLSPGARLLGKKNEKCPATIPGSVQWSGVEQFARACTTEGDFARLHTMSVVNGLAKYSETDFVPSGGDDGYRLVRGVSSEVPAAVPNAGAGILTPSGPGNNAAVATETCAIGLDFGFILCAAATFADAMVTKFQAIIAGLLDVNPLNVTGTGDAAGMAVYKIWDALRNIANVAFIIAFMIIVFSQATSIGLTSYGIKRLLPRLVLVAIMANISYFLCAAVIDLFNVLGAGVQGLMQAIMSSAGIKLSGLNLPSGTGFVEQITLTGIGAGALGVLIKAKGIEAIIIPLLVGVLILIVAVIALLIRQVLIVMMVITSSLAMVAWLLPNTENLFKRWYKFFIQMLIMYPMIMLVFAAGHLFAAIVASTAPDDPSTRTFYAGLALLSKWLVLGLIPWLFTAGGFAVGWLFNKGAALTQKASQGMQGSRGMRLRQEAREGAKNKAYLERLNGTRGGIKARANRATNAVSMFGRRDAQRELVERLYGADKKLENEKAEALQRRLTRNSALALGSRGKLDGNVFNFLDKNGNAVIDSKTGQAKTLKLDAEDMEAMTYADKTGATKSIAGARAVGGMLHELAEMNDDRAQHLIDMGTNRRDRAQINNALNQAAMKAGQWQWAYNSLTEDPDKNVAKINIAGQKSNFDPDSGRPYTPQDTAEGLANIISSKGLANMPKELFSEYDPQAVSTVLQGMYGRNSDAFIRQTLNINEDKKLDGIVKALGSQLDPAIKRNPVGQMLDASGNVTNRIDIARRAALEAERQRVGKAYSG